MVEVEVQNETYQSQLRLRFSVVPRIGEGIRLQEPGGFWASYDVLDLWYQKAEYGDVWVPYLHVRKTVGEAAVPPPSAVVTPPLATPLRTPLQTPVKKEVVPFAT